MCRKKKEKRRPFAEIISDGCFVEAFALAEELCNVIAGVLQQVVLDEELDPLGGTQCSGLPTAKGERKGNRNTQTYLLGVHVEFLSAHGHLFIPLHVFPKTHVKALVSFSSRSPD